MGVAADFAQGPVGLEGLMVRWAPGPPRQTRSRRNPQRTVLPHHRMAKVLYSHWRVGARCVCVPVRVMRCTACGAELILTNVVPDETATVRGVERHTFVCSECHVTEHRIVFIKDGRETDSPPTPIQAAQSIKPAPRVQDEHVSAPGLLGRVMARLRGH